MERVGVGNAKLLLFGEHSAVYGFASIGLGLPASTEIRVLANSERGWRFPELSAHEGDRFAEFLASATDDLPALRSRGGEIRISSTIPRALGFGSSAALCVALARAFVAESSSAEELWSIAHRAEGFFHGQPSGIDTGLSLLGGLRSFRPSPHALPDTRLIRDIPLHIVIGAVPRRVSTAALVGSLRARIDSGENLSIDLVAELGAIADRAIALMEKTDDGYPDTLAALGALLEAAHQALGRLALGDPGIDSLIRAGRELGALGGKQSGAGSGGAFFLLFPSELSARSAALDLVEFAHREGITLAAPFWVCDQPRSIDESRPGRLSWN